MKQVRCAIYTRKSSDEGLDQAFNSLDAQREACAAYILSQASEGWSALPDIYDDGGISGGTLERPALKRLLADIAAGRVDTVVVYKVDRLSRSLFDFAKLVELFEKAGTSFVSITQSFNTTTSMGRLTLNMLLSFAQFEREVTAERIRDKLAASKAKGLWMGGVPPLGYRPDGRTLAIVEDDAELIRDIYRRYLELGRVRRLAEQLDRERIRTPVRYRAGGAQFGGCAFTRGQLYAILKNPIYAGDIPHKELRYKGQHAAIIERDVWNQVQAMLADHIQGDRRSLPSNPSLLAGLITDEAGEPLVAVHANKGKVRHRYYVSRSLQHGQADQSSNSLRLPAREIETAVTACVLDALEDPLMLAMDAQLVVTPDQMVRLNARSGIAAERIAKQDAKVACALLCSVRLLSDGIEIKLSTTALAAHFQVSVSDKTPATFELNSNVRVTRTGRAVRLIQTSGIRIGTPTPNRTLVNLLVKAHLWWNELRRGQITVAEIAHRDGVIKSYVSRIVRLAFLAPDVVEAIIAGTQLAAVDGRTLKATDAVPVEWSEQRRRLLPAAN